MVLPALDRCKLGENLILVSVGDQPCGASEALGTRDYCNEGSVLFGIIAALFSHPGLSIKLAVVPFDEHGSIISRDPKAPTFNLVL